MAIAGSIGGAIQRHQPATLIHHQAFHDLLTVLPKCLGLEINETTAMKDIQFTTQRLHQLHQMGISLALDNFCSELISLTALKTLSFDLLKFDRAFVKYLATNFE